MAVLQYDFAVVGTQGINKAFARIERDAKRHSTRMDRIMGRSGAGARVASTAAAGTTTKASAKAASDTAKATERSVRTRERLEQQFNRRQLARFKRETIAASREKQRSEREKTRATERGVKERERLERQFNRRQLARFKRETIAANRESQKQAAAKLASRRAFVGGVGRSVRGAVGGVGRTAGTALGLGGGFAVASAVGHTIGLEREASELSNQAYRQGVIGKDDRESTRRSIMQQTRTVGEQTGIGARPLVGALRKFVEPSGRLDIGQAMLPVIAEFSDATGAAIEDVGKTAGQVVQAMVTRDPNAQLADVMAETEAILSTVAGQAKVGAIEFRDMATLMGKLMSATAGFDGQLSDLAGTLGAVGQISLAGGAASPEEAMTAILRFRDDLIQNQKRFKRAGGKVGGVNVFADKAQTKLRDPVEILAETLKATEGSLPKIKKLFGVRGFKAAQPFQAAFTEAGGGQAGIEAMNKVLESVRAARITGKERRESAQFVRGTTGRKFAIEMEQFRNRVGQDLLPVVNELLPTLADLAQGFAKLVKAVKPAIELFAKNPLAGIGAAITAKILFDIASAQIGTKVASVIAARAAAGAATQAAAGGAGAAGAGAAGAAGAKVAGAGAGAGGAAAAGGAAVVGTGLAIGLAGGAAAGGLVAGARGEEEAELAESGLRLSFLRDISPAQLANKGRRADVLRQAREQAGVITERGEEVQDIGTLVGETIGIVDPALSKTAVTLSKEAEERLKAIERMAKLAERLEEAGKSQEKVAEELNRMAGRFENIKPPETGGAPSRAAGQTPVKGGRAQ